MMITSEWAKDKISPIMGKACIAERCMMWRWGTVSQLANAVHERTILDDGGNGISRMEFVASWGEIVRPPEGYCGLAGVPSCAA